MMGKRKILYEIEIKYPFRYPFYLDNEKNSAEKKILIPVNKFINKNGNILHIFSLLEY
jgi:hypothetical protein